MVISDLIAYKSIFGFSTSKLNFTTDDSNFYGCTINVTDIYGDVVETATFSDAGRAVIYTGASGKLTCTCVGIDGTEAVRTVNITDYKIYNIRIRKAVLYGFRIVKGTADSEARVECLEDCDNAEYTPAGMDFELGTFNYGSWEDAFFMPRPCMLKYDGTVDYYLCPDDYDLREDGVTPSDVADTSYGGNAMMEFPKTWLWLDDDGTNINVYISNVQYNEGFTCYAHHDKHGNEIPYIYMPIYNGAPVNSVLRSMSGLTPINTQTGATEAAYALANGDDWDTETFADRTLVNMLLLLIGNNFNTQEQFGYGHYTGGSAASNLLATGTMNNKGLFYGSNSTGVGVKVFGMENWWGNQWRRIRGLMSSGPYPYVKLTYGTEDGTSITGWNITAVTGYFYLSSSGFSGTSGGYISSENVTLNAALLPYAISGSSDTYECDGVYFQSSSSTIGYAYVGGGCNDGLRCGAFAVALDGVFSYSHWNVGASVSCKPTAAAA